MLLLPLLLVLLAGFAVISSGLMLWRGLKTGVLPGQRGAGDLADRAGDRARYRRYLLFYGFGLAASLFFLIVQLRELAQAFHR